MPKAEDSHRAPKIELCEVMLDAIQAAIIAGDIQAFYTLLAPEFKQVGINAPDKFPEKKADLGEAFVNLARGEQIRFRVRMGIVRDYQRARWERWNAKRKNGVQTDNNALANAGLTDSKQGANGEQTVGYPSTDTAKPNTEAVADSVAVKPNTEAAHSPDTRPRVTRAHDARETDPDFDLFWEAFGKKMQRKDAERAFAKAKKAKSWPGIETVLAKVAEWRKSEQWSKDGGQFQPYASTWLNGERWEEQPPAAAPAQDKGVPPGLILHQEGEGKIREDF